MSRPIRRLGRGLDSLVSDLQATATCSPATSEAKPIPTERSGDKEGLGVAAAMLPVDDLDPNPFQPRDVAYSEDISSLAESIRRSGLLQPIIVRPLGGRHQIIAGERRWRAARSLAMSHVPVIIRQASDRQMLEFALVENIQREDLNAIDRARAYKEFTDRFGLRPDEVAARLGEDRSTVVNYLRLLELPESVQTLVSQGRLSMGHARCLLGIGEEDQRKHWADVAVQKGLSVRALEEVVRREKARGRGSEIGNSNVHLGRLMHLRDIQRRFEEAVKTKVIIREGKRKGTGRIVIEYYSLDDFDRIAAILGVSQE